jgi:hypothetical protein
VQPGGAGQGLSVGPLAAPAAAGASPWGRGGSWGAPLAFGMPVFAQGLGWGLGKRGMSWELLDRGKEKGRTVAVLGVAAGCFGGTH